MIIAHYGTSVSTGCCGVAQKVYAYLVQLFVNATGRLAGLASRCTFDG